jgi:hypothetical protein
MGTAFGIGSPFTYPQQPNPWGFSPFSGQGIGTYQQSFPLHAQPYQQALQWLQILPQQLQQLQQAQYLQHVHIQQALQLVGAQLHQLQQLQQLIQFLPQQLQQLQQQGQQLFGTATPGLPVQYGGPSPTPGIPFQPMQPIGSSVGSYAGHVM